MLERVLRLGRTIDYGLILANLAETWRAPQAPSPPAVDGSITLLARGTVVLPGADAPLPARGLAVTLPALSLHDMSAMAIAAVNGGNTVTDYAVSVGVTVRPDLPAVTPPAVAPPDLDGAVAAVGEAAQSQAARAGEAVAAVRSHAMIGSRGLQAALVLNAAENMGEVSGRIATDLAGLNGQIDDLSATALGAVDTGEIMAGIDAATREAVAGITGN